MHRALETYRFPRRLRGRDSLLGPLQSRLPPIFQDREELAASSDLAASVREALEQASSLIVICTPDGARSHWVNEEIRAFTALGRRDRIQCLIAAGVPNASRTSGDADQECLPPALFENGGNEPLASDIRPGQDGRAAAKLKLLAGITGVPYDELRQRELARRNRRLAIASAVLGALLLLMTGLAVAAIVARQEAVEQRDLARRKTLTAERTVDFVKSMFAVADPSETRGATVTAREIVDRGAARVERELVSEPAVRAELEITLGEVYTNLGLFNAGEQMIGRGLAIAGLEQGLRARRQLALAELRSWQGDDSGAAAAYARALALAAGPGSDRADLVPRIEAGLGETQGYLGKIADGERLVRRALAADLRRSEAGQTDVARDLEALGQIFLAGNRLADARQAYERALAIRLRRQGELHPRTMQDLNQLGSVAYLQKDGAAAERYFQRSLDLAERVLGPAHPEVAGTLNNVGLLKMERRAYAEALPLLRRAVAIQEAQRGRSSAELIFPLFNTALSLRGLGDPAQAARLLQRDQPIAEEAEHRLLPMILVERADIACARGDRAAAAPLIARARPLMERTYPDDPWRAGLVDLVDGECRGDRAMASRGRTAVLDRWPAATHFGARSRHH